MNNTNDDSGVNTLLLVVVIALLVGGGVWAYKQYAGTPAEDAAPTINVTLPTGNTEGQ